MPPTHSQAIGPRGGVWELYRHEIERLYIEENWTLRQIKDHMESECGFKASKSQFESHFRKWGLKKYGTSETWAAITPHVRALERVGKEPEVWIDGNKKPLATIKRQTTRNPQPKLSPLPAGVVVRAAPPPSPPHATFTYNLPFRAFRESLWHHKPSIPSARYQELSNFMSAAAPIHGVWNPDPNIRQALNAVVPSDLVNSADFRLPMISHEGILQVLFSVANNFAGMSQLDIGLVMDFVQRETGHDLYHMIKSSRECYTSQAIALSLFKAAVVSGNAMAVDFLLGEKWPEVHVDSPIFDEMQTPLERAVQLSRVDVVKVLLSHRPDLTYVSKALKSIWESVYYWKDPQLLHMLMSAGGDWRSFKVAELLRQAVHDSQLQSFLLQKIEWAKVTEEDICMIFELGGSELSMMAVDAMVRAGVDLNKQISAKIHKWAGKCVIDAAASHKDLKLVERLLQHGAKPTKHTFDAAVSKGDIQLVDRLLDAGVRPTTNTLKLAAIRGDIPIFRHLLGTGMKPTTIALYQATCKGHIPLVQYLLNAGVKPTTDTLKEAAIRGDISLVQHLLDAGAKSNTEALKTAVNRGDTPLVQCVLKSGVQLTADILVHTASKKSFQLTHLLLSAFTEPRVMNSTQYSPPTESSIENTELMDYLVRCECDWPDQLDSARPIVLGKGLLECSITGQRDIAIRFIDAGARTDIYLRHDREHIAGPPLVEALKHQDAVLVRALLDANASAYAKYTPHDHTPEYTPPLELAVQWGDQSIVRDLLQAGAGVYNHMHTPPMTIAINRGDTKTIHILLEAGYDLSDECMVQKVTPLEAAVRAGHVEMIDFLIERGANPRGHGAINAAIHQSTELLDLLLKRYALRYPHGCRGWGGDLLASALKRNDYDIFRKLLEGGADATKLLWEKEGPHQTSAYGHAIARVEGDKVHFVELLLNHRGEPRCSPDTLVSITKSDYTVRSDISSPEPAKVSTTAFLAAISSGNTFTVKLMLKYNADVNSPAWLTVKRTPLQRAAEMGYLELVELLLDQGADAHAPGAKRGGGTALQLAALGGFIPILRLLRRHGADIHAAASPDSWTCLEGAAAMGRLDMVAEILEAGATPQGWENKREMNKAIKLARGNCHVIVVRLLENFDRDRKVGIGAPDNRVSSNSGLDYRDSSNLEELDFDRDGKVGTGAPDNMGSSSSELSYSESSSVEELDFDEFLNLEGLEE